MPPLLHKSDLNCILRTKVELTHGAFLMTKKWSNLNLPGALQYVTGTVLHRMRIFKQEKCCIAFLEVFAALLQDWPSKLIAFVLMPDHFHLIVNPRDGDIRGFAGALKSLSARRIIQLTSDNCFFERRRILMVLRIKCGRRVSKHCPSGACG